MENMKKVFILLLLAVVAIVSNATQTSLPMKSVNVQTYNTNYTLTNTTPDTFLITAPRNYPASQAYSVNLDTLVSGQTQVAVSLYGSILGSSFTQIGSTVTWWVTTGDTTLSIANATANRYNYYRVIVVGTGTGTTTIDWQKFQIWTAGELSDGYASLSAGVFTGLKSVTVTKDADNVILDPGTDLHAIDVQINSASKFNVDTTGKVTAAAQIVAGAGVNLGTSQVLTGTTAVTIGAGTETVAVNSSDWDISTTGAMTGIGAITADGIITAGAGVTLPSVSTHIWSAGGSVVADTSGTNTTPQAGYRYWVEIMIPYNVTLTGISYLIGTVGGTDSVVIQLCNSAGVQVATTRTVLGAAALVGTAKNFQNVPFTATYAATAGLYYVAVQFNGTTARFRTFNIAGSKFVAGSASGAWGTKADITPGTTWTTGKGPIIQTY